jgi:hypothetical protein
MNRHDDDRDAEMTADWPGTGPVPAPADEDGEATAVVPRTPHAGPPPMSPPRQSAPPMSPPQGGQWGPPPGGGGGWGPPAAPGQYPPPYPPAPTPPQKGTPWGLIGVGGVAVAVIAVVATWFVMRGGDSAAPAAGPASSTSAAPSPTATASSAPSATVASPTTSATPAPAGAIEPAALKGLLASVPEINQLVGNATMTPNATFDAPYKEATVDPFTCIGAVQPGADATYNGSGYTGFAGQLLTDAPQENKVLQYIVSFPSDAEAKAFVDKQVAGWEACKFTDITLSTGSGQAVSNATVGVTANTDGTPSVLIFPPSGGPGRQCQHAMTPRKNVVVDVRACAPSVGSMGWTLARDIGEKITGQR